MTTLLIVLTLVELLLLVLVLAGYLITIAASLRRVSSTLGLVTFGVRAIEKQTEPIGPVLTDINKGLEQVAAALGEVARRTPAMAEAGGQPGVGTQAAGSPESPGETQPPGP
jgi:hypothetical protein